MKNLQSLNCLYCTRTVLQSKLEMHMQKAAASLRPSVPVKTELVLQ